MSAVKAKAGAKGGSKGGVVDVAAGNKKRRRRRVTTVVEDGDPVCSACNSRLVSIKDVDRLSTLSLGLVCSSTLSCAACGSALTPLRDLAR